MSNLKGELKFYEVEHRYYYDRLSELNSLKSVGDIDTDQWMIETRKLISDTMERYDDILSHILKGYKEI